LGEESPVPSDRKLGGPQSRSGRGAEEKIIPARAKTYFLVAEPKGSTPPT